MERRRLRVIELLEQGLNLTEASAKVGCSVSAACRWRQKYRRKGLDSLRSKPLPGIRPKLTAGQKKRLTRILLAGAQKTGYSTDLWTQKRVASVIRDRFGVDYHPNHMWRFLQGLGWSVQKPVKKAVQRDEKAIAHWKRHVWPHIKKNRKA